MHRAVTILELLLVLAILASILTLAAPALLPLVQERRFDATQQMLRDWLWRVRSDAVTRGYPLMVHVQDSPEGVLVLARRADFSEVADDEPRLEGATDYERRFHLGDGLEISLSDELPGPSAEASIRMDSRDNDALVLGLFLPSGGAVQTQEFFLHDQRGRRQGLRLSPLTGRLLLIDPGRESELPEFAPADWSVE